MIERLRVGSIGENCYLLPLGKLDSQGLEGCIVVDPGAEEERIVGAMDARKLSPLLIACTHGHLDHCAAIGALRDTYIGRGHTIPIAIHHLDQAYLGARGHETNRRLFAAIGAEAFFEAMWLPLPEADILLKDGDFLLDSSWKVMHTPGHSAGSVCFFDEARSLLVSGDTLFRDGVGRTDGPDSDESALRESIEARLFTLPADTRIFPGHGEPTTIGRESG